MNTLAGMTGSSGLSVLERMLQFGGERQRLIAHNIANISTPGFRPVDVSVEDFQAQLAEAVDRRRASGEAELPLSDTREVEAEPDRLILRPVPIGENILFHDGNDRSLERLMQDLSENLAAYRFAAEMMRTRLGLINTAIRERL
jgi:flagellar basal-body rod protein FlgB